MDGLIRLANAIRVPGCRGTAYPSSRQAYVRCRALPGWSSRGVWFTWHSHRVFGGSETIVRPTNMDFVVERNCFLLRAGDSSMQAEICLSLGHLTVQCTSSCRPSEPLLILLAPMNLPPCLLSKADMYRRLIPSHSITYLMPKLTISTLQSQTMADIV